METTLKFNAEQAENISERLFTPAQGMQTISTTPATSRQTKAREGFHKSPLWIGHIIAQFLDGQKPSTNNPTKHPNL